MAVTNYYSVGGAIIGERTVGSPRIDYLTDALGSVTATVSQSGAVQNTYWYRPYGAQLAKTGSAPDPKFTWVGASGYRQTGAEFSEAYVRARHYAQTTSNWITVDPLWPDEHAYSYVKAKATTWIDSSGLACTLRITRTVSKLNCDVSCDCVFPFVYACTIFFRYHAYFTMQFTGCSNCKLYQWFANNGGTENKDSKLGWPIMNPRE